MRGLRFILAWVAVGDLFGQSVGQPSQYGGDIRAEWPRVEVPEGAGAGRDTEPAPQWEVVDPKLQELIHQGAQSLPVFVVLRSQPHREVLERYEGPARLRLEMLEARYKRAVGRLIPLAAEVEQTRADWEREALAVSEAAFREIARLIEPEQEAVERLILRLGGRNVRRYSAINMLAAEVPAAAVDTLAAHPAVAEISLIEKQSAQLDVSVPSLGAPVFWAAGYTGAGESVAVMDTGVRTSHPAFSGLNIVSKVFLDYDKQDPCFGDDATSPEDKQGHGTHVAGIVASRGAPGWSNYWGVARGLGTLYNLKIAYLDKCTGRAWGVGAADALEWSIQQAPWVKVFNYSYGRDASGDDDVLARLFDYFADTYGLTISVSAGNESKSGFLGLWTKPGPVSSPGIGYNVITVAAMNTQGTVDRSDDEIAIFSSRGPTAGGRKKPDIAAPGGLQDRWELLQLGWVPYRGIYSAAYNSDGFIPMPGTSMAAPHIAGAAALLRQAGITDPLAIKALLLNTSDQLYWDEAKGWGYANLARAFDQRRNVLSAEIPFNRVRLYKGTATGLFYATLTWNRYVYPPPPLLTYPCLSDLYVTLYDGTTGAMLSRANSDKDNVEKTYTNFRGPIVVTVGHGGTQQCRSPEKFGLASSHPLQPALAGLSASCSAPAAVTPGSRFTVTCTVRNVGDLPLFAIAGPLNWKGSTGGASQDFGTLQPGESSSRSWQVTAPSSSGTFTLQLDVSSASFGARISLSAEVSFTTQSCTYVVTPTQLSVAASGGQANISVNTQAGCPWTATSNVGWITVSSGSSGTGSGSVSLTIAANSSAQSRTGMVMVAGQTVTVSQAGGIGNPVLAVSPTELQFTWSLGGAMPAPQTIQVTSTTGAALNWTASVAAGWIRIWPASGNTPASVSVTVDPTGLGAGNYTGTVAISGPGLAERTVTVRLTVTAPTPIVTGIVNAASFQPGMVPGGLASLFGKNLSTVSGLELPGGATSWKGTWVSVEGRQVPLLAISRTGEQEQINFQVPFELGAPASVTVVVSNNGATATLRNVPLLRVQPGLFEWVPPGSPRYAAAVKLDGSVVGPGNPVAPGDAVMLFLTGMGPVIPVVPTGQPGPVSPLAETWLKPTVLIGGIPAQVLFSGYAPGFLGLYQVNVVIPDGAPAGAAKLEVLVEGVPSQPSLILIR
jgi:uncharacterized protein (TIGR03437 family)